MGRSEKRPIPAAGDSALLPFLDVETAGKYRDQSLDAEVDLSACSFISTANDATKIPGPLRDRMRMIYVPAPTLQHLPALAAQVMQDLSRKDETGDAPLADDELAIIGKAWSASRFSMRTLSHRARHAGGARQLRDASLMMGARQDLLRDSEAYTSGETPSPLVMLRALKIHGWTVAVRRRGKEFVLVVAGTVIRHPQHPDGESVGVPVAWFDRHLRWIRSHRRVYALGEPSGDEADGIGL